MKKQLLLLVMMLLPMAAMAYDFALNGIAYNITSVANRTAEVTYYGSGGIGNFPNNEEKPNYGYYHGVITIPNEVEYEGVKYSVTAIGNRAFIYTYKLEEVIFPNSIKTIGDHSFYFSNINKIVFPPQLSSLGEACFMYCTYLKEVKIPETISSLPDGAFSYSGIEKIDIPQNIKKIGYNCFCDCENLKEVIFRGNVSMLTHQGYGSRTFINCKNIGIITSLSLSPSAFDNNTFDSSIYLHSILKVPHNAIDIYKSTEGWNNFVHIEEDTNYITMYKLTYLVDGNEYRSYDVELGTTITPEPAPTKEGYTFSGWSEIPETMPAHDVTVTGTFSINKYKLTYTIDGKEYKSYEVEYGATITPEPAPTKEGHTFSGWSWIPTKMPAEDVTVTGTFAVNKYKLIYKVDGEVYKSYEVEYGATITPEDEPTKEGYSFSGWSWIPTKMPAEDVSVSGYFIVNQYTITYIIDNEVYTTDKVDYGSTITPPTPPAREGYDFAWGDYPETMPAHDITIYGTYTTGIDAIMVGECGNAKIYTLDGKLLDKPQKGINIVRMNDGTTKKVVVK